MNKKTVLLTLFTIVIVLALIIVRLISNKMRLEKDIQSISTANAEVPVLIDTAVSVMIDNRFSVNGTYRGMSELTLVSETQGTVTGTMASPGSVVEEHQFLASVDHEVVQAQLELAKANYEKSETDLRRFELMSKQDAISTQQLEEARLAYLNAKAAFVNTQRQFDNTTIKAPVGGIITKRYIDRGTYLTPGMNLFDLVKLDRIKFVVRLTADEILGIRKEDTVLVTVDAYPGAVFTGTVYSLGLQADDSKRYEVEVVAANNPLTLRNGQPLLPGMYGTAVFRKPERTPSLIIPRDALVSSIKEQEVFILAGNVAEVRTVVVQPYNDQSVIVKEGLQEGDIVITKGQINLQQHTPVRVVNR